MDWFLLGFKRYLEFNGRSRRKEFWMFYLFNVITSITLSLIDVSFSLQVNGINFLSTLLVIITVIPWLALSVRRLHDINKSGLFLLLYFLPVIGWIWLFILLIKNGDIGPNKYGSDPKNQVSELDDIGVVRE